MKPICSIKGGWCIKPVKIEAEHGGLRVENYALSVLFDLPNDMTFEQFMLDYASCTVPIYFVEAARFIKAYMDTGVEKLSDEQQAFASASPDIEFAYDFCDNQIGWADGEYGGQNQGWHE